MIEKKDGFQGERSVVLSPMLTQMEEHDELCRSLFITDIGYFTDQTADRTTMEILRVGQDQIQIKAVFSGGFCNNRLTDIFFIKHHANQQFPGLYPD